MVDYQQTSVFSITKNTMPESPHQKRLSYTFIDRWLASQRNHGIIKEKIEFMANTESRSNASRRLTNADIDKLIDSVDDL